MLKANTEHDRLVAEVSATIIRCRNSVKKVKVYHGASNSTRRFSSDGLFYVDASGLRNIIEVNQSEQYVLVEPNVPLDALVTETLKHGLVPPLVAEFPGITVGGAVQGGSGESSSFKWGTFHDTCLEYEIVLGDGTKVIASRTEHADLFWGMSCAFGSLGVMTLLKVRLVPATKNVRLRYYPARSHQEAVQKIQSFSKDAADFIDGIMFSKTSGVVMLGNYYDGTDLPKASFSHFYDDWFYIHAENVIAHQEYYEEVIPLKDYLFRYDRGGFWTAKLGFSRMPFNRFTRVLLSGLFKTRTLLKLLHASDYSYVYMTQDLCLPEERVLEFINFVDQEYEIYPLWLCPLKPAREDTFSCTAIDTDLVINVGVWGAMKQAEGTFTERNRRLEHEVATLGGRKVLYAHSYYTEEEFWKIYDNESYTKLRKKYYASQVFPNLYQKTRTRPITRKPSKFRGFIGLIASPYGK
jgi:delta24-sterol reductase